MSRFGTQTGDLAKLKSQLAKRTSSGSFLRFIPKDGDLTVRFLEEPTEWVCFTEHWDDALNKSYPCPGAACPGCAAGLRSSTKYATNALLLNDSSYDGEHQDRVIQLSLPKSLVVSLVARYERYTTMCDRDYVLSRTGKGLDTKYLEAPEAPMPRKLDKWTEELKDIEEILVSVFNDTFGLGDSGDTDSHDDAGAPRLPGPRTERPTPTIGEDEDEDDAPSTPAGVTDAPTSHEGVWTAEDLDELPVAEVRSLARDTFGLKTTGMSRSALVTAILNRQDEEPF